MNPFLRALLRGAPVAILAARRAWPHIQQMIQENPQITARAKDTISAFSTRHRRATIEDIERRITALREYVEGMPEETSAVAVYGSEGVTRAAALARLEHIDSSIHALEALTANARPAAIRRISYELDHLAAEVLVPKHH